MAQSQAARTVFIAGALMAGVTIIEDHKNPGAVTVYKRLFALGVLTLGLSVAADWAPQLIVPFAIAIVVAFTLGNPGFLSGALTGTGTAADTSSGSSGSAGSATHTSKGIGGKI